MADWVASLDIDGWSLGLALLTAIATWVIAVLRHHPMHGVAVRSAVVDAVADALASRSLVAVVTSDVPATPLTPADRI